MVDIQRLKALIDDSGLPMTVLSRKTGIERPTLYNRFKGVGEFTASEIVGLSKALHLTNEEVQEIFLSQKVN